MRRWWISILHPRLKRVRGRVLRVRSRRIPVFIRNNLPFHCGAADASLRAGRNERDQYRAIRMRPADAVHQNPFTAIRPKARLGPGRKRVAGGICDLRSYILTLTFLELGSPNNSDRPSKRRRNAGGVRMTKHRNERGAARSSTPKLADSL
jgi:hypothetical protein